MENTAPVKLGRYEIVRELGKGAMGVVYEGKDPSLGRRVAIKTARKDVIERSGLAKEMMERFLREARAAGVLNHPNIITIYDVGEEAGMAYIAMEYLEGRDLDTLIEEQRRFDVQTVVDFGVQICEALACAHAQGVFHRDVKPANIFVPDNGVLKVVDFGIARTHDSTLTQDGALIGTPTYMSPEQFMGQKVDARSDLFSAGIILYEMLTGEKPFTGEALTTIMHHILKSDPAPPHELNYMVPEHLSAVVMRALSKKAKDRYINGHAMALALREGLKDNPDMSFINGVKATVAETVVTKVPVAKKMEESVPDGTIIEEETLPTPGETQNKLSSATVAGNVPDGFDDFLDGPTAASDDIVPKATPQPTRKVSVPVPSSKPSLSQTVMQHGRLIFGSIAVLCLVVGIGTVLLAPEQAPPREVDQPVVVVTQPAAVATPPAVTPVPTPEPVTTPPTVTPDTTPVPAVSPEGEPELTTIPVNVFISDIYTLARDFQDLIDSNADDKTINDWISEKYGEGLLLPAPKEIKVSVYDPAGTPLVDGKELADGMVLISLPLKIEKAKFLLSKSDGTKLHSGEITFNNATPVAQTFVPYMPPVKTNQP